MLNKYDVSVIIPHYNTPELLIKLLYTIPRKNNIQVIVIDDKSNLDLDKLEECKRICKMRKYMFVNNEKKKGAGTCRNIGIDIAEGKWILFADADDYFKENLWEKLSKYIDSDNDIVYFTPTSVYLGTNLDGGRHYDMKKVVFNYLQEQSIYNELQIKYRYSSPCSKLIRAEYLKKNNIFFDEISVANDVMFSVKSAWYANKIAATKEVIYVITRSKGTLSTKIDINSYMLRLNVFIEKYKFLENNLKKEEFRLLELTGQGRIFNAIQNGYTVAQIFSIYKILRKHKVRIINAKMFNPQYVITSVREEIKIRKMSKDYFVK